jgi:hypothetical protein
MNQDIKFWRVHWGLVLMLSGVLSGCASSTERRRHQYVYIQSEPPGATILDKGREIGSTPGLVRLRRDRNHTLELKRADEQKLLVLETKYAWNESFVGNLVFSSLAPLGWLTDLATGASWNYQDPEPVKLSSTKAVKMKTLRLAIAPPIAESFTFSDEAAQYWEKQLPKLYPEMQVIPFTSSLPLFQEIGYDYDEQPNDEQRHRQLLFDLQADRIFFSQVRKAKNAAVLHAELKDHSGKILEEKSAEAPLVSQESWKNSALEMIPSWFQFIPNTVGVEFSGTNTYLSDNLVQYNGIETQQGSTFGKALSYLQALTLSHLQIPRIDRPPRWRNLFTPAARFSYKTVFFPDFAKLADVDFIDLQAGIGIGPESGYQSGKHYTYFRGIPLWSFHQIDWHQPGGGNESMTVGSLDFQFEFGYLYFLNDRMSIRLFSKATSAGTNLWNSVAQRVNPTTPPLTTAGDSYSGFAIGYTFDLSDRLASQ